jgi:transcriptional regulator with XRE-family HTH domain
LQKLTKIAGAGQKFLVSYSTVIKLESSDITNLLIDTLQKLAKALNVGVDDLLK